MAIAMERSAPGVYVLVNTSEVSRPVDRQPTSTFFLVCVAHWGAVGQPILITSEDDFDYTCGGPDNRSFGDDAIRSFFRDYPGTQALVSRVVGPAAALATVSLNDVAGVPAPTLRIDSKYYPSPSIDLRYKVEAGTEADTRKLTFRSIFLNRKEVWDNFKMDADSIERINQGSELVQLTDLISGSDAPENLPLLNAGGVEALLAGGSDDYAGVNAGRYIGSAVNGSRSGLHVFDDEALGTGQVAVPGITDETVHLALQAHAEAYHRFALIDPPLGSSDQEAADVADAVRSQFVSVTWPWVERLSYEGDGLRKFYPPSGFVAGACAKVDREIGIHKAPANIQIPNAINVERHPNGQSQIDDNVRAFLNTRGVNVIAPIPHAGIRIYGARPTSYDRRVSTIHERRTLSMIRYSLKIAYQFAVFGVIDGSGSLQRTLISTTEQFLRALWKDGALYGKTEEEAFVVTDASVPAEIANGLVTIKATVKISQMAEQITLLLNNAPVFEDLSTLR